MIISIGGSNCGTKLLQPVLVSWERDKTVIHNWDSMHPTGRPLLTGFFNNGVAVNLDVITGLSDVDPIEHVQIALAFDGDGEAII